jgi:hypothetical protein
LDQVELSWTVNRHSTLEHLRIESFSSRWPGGDEVDLQAHVSPGNDLVMKLGSGASIGTWESENEKSLDRAHKLGVNQLRWK